MVWHSYFSAVWSYCASLSDSQESPLFATLLSSCHNNFPPPLQSSQVLTPTPSPLCPPPPNPPGLFQGPHTTGEAIKGGRLVAEVMSRLGFRVIPGPEPHLPSPPSMITAVELGSREAMVAFCKGIQLACPVGSYITPEPGEGVRRSDWKYQQY